MCKVFYIAAHKELPLVEPQDWNKVDTMQDGWQSKVVPFSVEPLDETNRAVSDKFEYDCIRYAGSFEGCGCGFGVCVIDEDSDPPGEHEMAGRVSHDNIYTSLERMGQWLTSSESYVYSLRLMWRNSPSNIRT